jgi:tetratricopeptide (TPR) repeat protein
VGPFCNSDKYSFLLAFSMVMERIPQQLREMMERGEAAVAEVMQEESRSAAYIRRMYLQDVYRFYRIYPRRSEFYNPFDRDGDDYLFFANPVFTQTHLEPYFNEIAAFLIKQKRQGEAGLVLENMGAARRDFRFYMMAGYLEQRGYFAFEMEGATDLSFYQKALELQPDNERALLGYARACFGEERYDEALEAYERLLTMQPDKRNYLLNRAVCLSRMKRYGDALKDLYRLNYETPGDQNVNRVLAWTLTCEGKYEQADKLYRDILAGNAENDDLLNYGYCLWLSGHVDDAADCFHRYLGETDGEPSEIIEKERELLEEKGISEPEMQLMLYVL